MTVKLTVIKNAEHSPMGDLTPAKLPIGDVVAQSRLGQDVTLEASSASVGVWECSPGVFRRHIMNREFSHVVAGWCIFTPDGGEPGPTRSAGALFALAVSG